MKVDDEERHLFAVPKEMRKVFVVKYHDLMSHFGLDRSMAKLWHAKIFLVSRSPKIYAATYRNMSGVPDV